MTPIQQTFARAKQTHSLQLMPFIPAGYPSLEATAETLISVGSSGAGLIEVGIPFSDPIADGPVIQQAFTDALAAGVKLAGVLETVRSVKARVPIPLVAMVSYSIAFRKGIRTFSRELKAAGFDGLILPDLPPPEAQGICEQIWEEGLDTILLVAPTTPADRRAEIARLSSGFIYYLSVSGITGERASLPSDLAAGLKQMRDLTDKPVCVGFGISKRDHIKQLEGHADGAIVGSALVKRMMTGGNDAKAVAAAASDLCRELIGA